MVAPVSLNCALSSSQQVTLPVLTGGLDGLEGVQESPWRLVEWSWSFFTMPFIQQSQNTDSSVLTIRVCQQRHTFLFYGQLVITA